MTTESYGGEDAAENSGVDVLYWPHIAKIGFIECDSKAKEVHVPGWQKLDLNKINYEANQKIGLYKNGIAIRLGRCLSPFEERFSFALDFDGWDAIQEWFGTWENVLEMSKKTRIEWHQDKTKLHMILFSNRPVTNRKIKIKDSLLEIRCEKNLLYSYPSFHMDGNQYNPLGTYEIAILAEPQLLGLESKIDSLCEGYMSDENKSEYIKWLENPDNWKSLGVGQGRHNALVILGTSYYYRYSNGWRDLTDDDRKQRLWEMNQQLIVPKPEPEFNLIWKWIIDKHRKSRDQQHEELDDARRHQYDGSRYSELKGNVFYQINVKPPKFIIALKQNKQLVEATIKTQIKDVDGKDMICEYLMHNKTSLTCIPTKIVRHKNPLKFLDQAAKYTMSFEDAADEHYTFSHKTLSEILNDLKDLGYVLKDGAEGALGTMVQAFKENKIIEDNEDMDFTGFFIVDKKIMPSIIEIKEVAAVDLEDALKFIEELVPYYEGRLDLLSTLIVWGLVAPTIFMLKTNNYFLKWFHFYGFPNATKSNSGKIVLGIDGHQDNPDFILNISRIDTIARLGDILSHTTFPKLVDEADLNAMDKGWLVNAMKSAIEGKIARSKFLTNRSTSSTPIPALSPLILTSNSPPPFHDSGYMRRIIDRNFAKSESHKEDDPIAIKFKEFLRTDLSRLRHLGDFRNWFIVNNQDIFLDETRLLPLDLGLKILTTAYEKTGREMPKWFNMRLPECQLEDSIGDNTVIVKRAFETYIDVNFKNSLSFWRLESPETVGLKLPDKVSHRLVKLMDSNLLPDIKRTQSHEIIIRKGVLLELYKWGVTREQLPNLRALADYMNASYRKSDGNKVVSCTESQLDDYFDKIEVAGDNV